MKNCLKLTSAPVVHCLCAALLLGLISTTRAFGESEQSLIDRFLHEAPSSWKEYEKRVEFLQGTCVYRFLESASGPDVQTTKYKTNGEGRLFLFESAARKQREVFGANPRYAFHLVQQTRDGPWVVGELIDLVKQDIPQAWRVQLDGCKEEANTLVRLGKRSLAEMASDESFRVLGCKEVQRDGDNFVEVAFVYDKDPLGPRDNAVATGIMILDPKRFWALRSAEYNVQYKDPARPTLKHKYNVASLGETTGSIPFAKVVEDDYVWAHHTVLRREHDLEFPIRLPADEEFTLSAFGLPEPPGLEWKKPTRWYLWIALGGVCCLAAGVAVWRFRRPVANVAS